jgi:hypothetical protein
MTIIDYCIIHIKKRVSFVRRQITSHDKEGEDEDEDGTSNIYGTKKAHLAHQCVLHTYPRLYFGLGGGFYSVFTRAFFIQRDMACEEASV